MGSGGSASSSVDGRGIPQAQLGYVRAEVQRLPSTVKSGGHVGEGVDHSSSPPRTAVAIRQEMIDSQVGPDVIKNDAVDARMTVVVSNPRRMAWVMHKDIDSVGRCAARARSIIFCLRDPWAGARY